VLLPPSRYTVALWFENLPGTMGLHVAHWSCWAFAQAPSHEPSFCGATFSSPASSVIPWERRTASMLLACEIATVAWPPTASFQIERRSKIGNQRSFA
jgi:hypothetical protein